jgi:hypothetical protein
VLENIHLDYNEFISNNERDFSVDPRGIHVELIIELYLDTFIISLADSIFSI